jgi:uncharacterized protein (DUF58 family)
VLRQVRRLEFRTRRLVDSHFSGEYPSVFRGQGLEFAEVREYLPGDDVRTIDWNVTARSGVPHVKTYTEERELSVLLAVDVSGSVRFGSRVRFKSDVVAEVAATLALSAARNNDRVALTAFTDRVEASVPPRKGRRHALRIVRDLLALAPAGRGTDLAAALAHGVRLLPARSVIFLFSDFAGVSSSSTFERALATASVRHDIVPVVISDPADTALPELGLAEIRDPETGEMLVVDSSRRSVREQYAASIARDHTAATRLFRRRGLDTVHLRTDEPYAPPLLAFFRSRERRFRS